MKKDIFNGKIKSECRKLTIFTLVFVGAVFFAIATAFLLFGLLYEKVSYGARIALLTISILSYLLSVFYPITTILCIRKYPKHKALTKLFIQNYVFVDTESKQHNVLQHTTTPTDNDIQRDGMAKEKYVKIFTIIRRELNKVDPVKLMPGEVAPIDEYNPEVKMILEKFTADTDYVVLAKNISKIFSYMFGEAYSEKLFYDCAKTILEQVSNLL